jgi:hypothetical protein
LQGVQSQGLNVFATPVYRRSRSGGTDDPSAKVWKIEFFHADLANGAHCVLNRSPKTPDSGSKPQVVRRAYTEPAIVVDVLPALSEGDVSERSWLSNRFAAVIAAGSVVLMLLVVAVMGVVRGKDAPSSPVAAEEPSPQKAQSSLVAVGATLSENLRRAGFSDVSATLSSEYIAHLTGSSVNEEEKKRALQIAAGVPGIRSVIDGLRVATINQEPQRTASIPQSPAPAAPKQRARRTDSAASMASLQAEINAELQRARLGSVMARVDRGMSVSLSGAVDTPTDLLHARRIAAAHPRVRSVQNNVSVSAPEHASPVTPAAPQPQPFAKPAPQEPSPVVAAQRAQSVCANRGNFVSRRICESRECKKPEHSDEERCRQIRAFESQPAFPSSGD